MDSNTIPQPVPEPEPKAPRNRAERRAAIHRLPARVRRGRLTFTKAVNAALREWARTR